SRDLDRQQDLATGRPVRAGELEQPPVDRADPDHRRYRDREEDEEPADDYVGEEPRPEPQREERGQSEDRNGLGGHEVRREEAFDETRTRERVARDDAARGGGREPECDLHDRRPGVWRDGPVGPGGNEPGRHDFGRRQDGDGQSADDDDELPEDDEGGERGDDRPERAGRQAGGGSPGRRRGGAGEGRAGRPT